MKIASMAFAAMAGIILLSPVLNEEDGVCIASVKFVGKTRSVEVLSCNGTSKVLHGSDADNFVFLGRLPRS
jgi:hypothetical protein